ncbi:MAG: FAD-binding oxidoreductase [Flavipsychrobacter sp.]|jgi:glycine/D-amino acid oxidase-like deaminating enzyme|nr:FAD-binding oxidoreductase [Flavipsychrobacter sp.]
MLSYWEQQSFLHYDHIIVGSGIVGLSTAIELKERFPSARVLVLERGLLPTGASSRNAGFACMGSLTELLDDNQYATDAQIVELFDQRKKGLERLRNRLGNANIGYAQNGSYELIGQSELGTLDHMDRLNDLLLPITQQPAFRLVNEKITDFGFSTNYTKALIENTCEGELHTGKMLRALSDLALSKGIEIKTGAEVTRFEDNDTYVAVFIADPVRGNELALHANTLSLCTNAFTSQLLPGEDVKPGRGQVLVTQPIPDLKFKGVYHFDKGYYYFREIDGRILLGGGRNLDFEGETTTDIALNPTIQIDLEQKLRGIIIPGVHYHIELRWAGIMAFGATKQPIVKAHSKRVFGAYRMGGMGVALGSQSAMQLADIIQSQM